MLDTIKRGDDDHFSFGSSSAQTVVLRLYEAYGGAGKVHVVSRLPEGKKVVKAEIVDVRHPFSLSASLGAHLCSSGPR